MSNVHITWACAIISRERGLCGDNRLLRPRIVFIVMDVVMPVLGGPDACSRMSALGASTPVIFTTGYTAEAASLNFLVREDAMILQKPYSLKSLGQMIRSVLDRKLSG